MPGPTPPPNLQDVARAAGVSLSSASVALRGERGVSEATRGRVLAAATRLGYRADRRARLLRERRARLIGVTFHPEHGYHAALIDPLYTAAQQAHHELVLAAATATRTHADAAADLIADGCSALVLLGPDLSTSALTDLSTRVPAVSVGTWLRPPGVDEVHADDENGVHLAVTHLLDLGHRDIAFIDGGDRPAAAPRRRGYRTAMRHAGLAARVLHAAPTEEAGVTAARRLMAAPTLPTALVAHNDRLALGLLLTLRAHGVAVPGDVSLVGYDDVRLAGLPGVELTTVSQDPTAQAQAAVDRAIARSTTDEAARVTMTTPRLIVRGSTAAPR